MMCACGIYVVALVLMLPCKKVYSQRVSTIYIRMRLVCFTYATGLL